jgi:hypothetical protein
LDCCLYAWLLPAHPLIPVEGQKEKTNGGSGGARTLSAQSAQPAIALIVRQIGCKVKIAENPYLCPFEKKLAGKW